MTTVSACTHSIPLGFHNRNPWCQMCKTGHPVWILFYWTELWWLTVLHTVLLSRRQITACLVQTWDRCDGFPPCVFWFLQQYSHMLPFFHWLLYLWEWIIWYCSLLSCVFLTPVPVCLCHWLIPLSIYMPLVLAVISFIPEKYQWWHL